MKTFWDKLPRIQAPTPGHPPQTVRDLLIGLVIALVYMLVLTMALLTIYARVL